MRWGSNGRTALLAPHFVPAGKSGDKTRLMATDDGEEQTTMECFEKGEDRAGKSNTSNKLESYDWILTSWDPLLNETELTHTPCSCFKS